MAYCPQYASAATTITPRTAGTSARYIRCAIRIALAGRCRSGVVGKATTSTSSPTLFFMSLIDNRLLE